MLYHSKTVVSGSMHSKSVVITNRQEPTGPKAYVSHQAVKKRPYEQFSRYLILFKNAPEPTTPVSAFISDSAF